MTVAWWLHEGASGGFTMHQDKDRSAKWLLSHHGDAVLKLAGLAGFTAWKHLPSEVVAPRRTFDGLLQVTYPDEPEPRLVLIEVESYGGSDTDRQVFDDLLLVALEYRKIPEVVSLVMKPKGNLRVAGAVSESSPGGTTRLSGQWPVVRLWELDAQGLLDDGDVGLIPWVPLTRSARPTHDVLFECVGRIRKVADAGERAGLLAVTFLLTSFAHPGYDLFSIFGGKGMVIDFESVGMKQLGEAYRERYQAQWEAQWQAQWELEFLRGTVTEALEARFGAVPGTITDRLNAITDANQVRRLHRVAVTCHSFDDFLAEASKQ